jgi:adenine-specific DNA-methyltransferase
MLPSAVSAQVSPADELDFSRGLIEINAVAWQQNWGNTNLRDTVEIEQESNVRSLGAYYTPSETASALVRWAVRTGNENILEPSAGGGALLCAAFEHARSIRPDGRCQITAFDIDPRAISNLKGLKIDELHVKHGDFLEELPPPQPTFNLVLANPPFNRNHSLSADARSRFRTKFDVKGAAGLWVYFLLHSLNFLQKNGRLAIIVPRSACFTVHGQDLLARLCKSFGSVGIYELESKPEWSSYAEESGAVILAEDYLARTCEAPLRGVLRNDGSIEIRRNVDSATYRAILEKSKPLSAFAQISIGAVTGRNSVFLLSEAERLDARIDRDDVLPVVSRRRHISGITLSRKELASLAEAGQKTWMLAPRHLTGSVARYLKVVSEEERISVVWFRKRNPWWKVQIDGRYHAVFTYMNDLGPRLVRLAPGIVCTNTLHRVEFRSKTPVDVRLSSFLSFISTFGQLAAEKTGRAYSGGVLKFEIAEARNLPVLAVDQLFTYELFKKVDTYLRAGEHDRARLSVDKAFMPSLFGRSWKQKLEELEIELSELRAARRGG